MCVKTTAFILFADDYSLTCEQKSGTFYGFFLYANACDQGRKLLIHV